MGAPDGEDVEVSKIGVFTPPNHPILIGFSMIFTIHFGGKPAIFGNTYVFPIEHGDFPLLY